jgi:hypothetical protein
MVARKKVKWLEGDKANQKVLHPHPLISELPITSYINHESLREGLVVGRLWFTHCRLIEQKRFTQTGHKAHEFPYLEFGHFEKGAIEVATPAIYAGVVRVEEMSSGGTMTRALRHSFIIGGRRYITANIGKYFYPA